MYFFNAIFLGEITQIDLSKKMENLFAKPNSKSIKISKISILSRTNFDISIPNNARYFRDLGIDTIGVECLAHARFIKQLSFFKMTQ
jgi:hypothetical protein